MKKERLFTPGPTMIPLEVLQAMERPVLHHRTDVFKKILRQAADGAKWLLGSDHDPIFLAASGTGAMEAVIRNMCPPGSTIVTVNGGVFGERWKKIAERCGVNCREITCPVGESITPDQVCRALSDGDASLFCIQHCETSTTVLHPLQELLHAVKSVRPDVLTVVDGISACANAPLPSPRSLIDVYIAGSQKALMLPPGLAIVDLSGAAWALVERTPKSTLYFDLLIERESLKKDTTAWTPATTLICGFVAAIELMQKEGLNEMFERQSRFASAVRAGLAALDLQLMAPKFPSPGVTGFFPPAGVDAEALRSLLKTRFGMRVAGGQAALTGKVLRIGHMGYVDTVEIIGCMGCLELGLAELGTSIKVGQATSAVLNSLNK